MGISVMVVLLSATTFQNTPADSTLEIPFTLHRDHLLVVRGRVGHLRDLLFIVDTGAGSTIINSSVATALGLKGPSTPLSSFGTGIEAAEVEIPSVELGSYRLDRLRALAAPLDAAAKALGMDRLDGLIGIDVLRRRSFAVDYRKRLLSIAGPIRAVRHRAPFIDDPIFAMVRAEVNQQPFNLIVDTGASHLVLFQRPDGSEEEPVQKGAHVAGIAVVRAVRIDRLRIGKWTNRALVAVIAPKPAGEPAAVDGLLSLRTIDADFVQFDFDKREIGWRQP